MMDKPELTIEYLILVIEYLRKNRYDKESTLNI
jgi:hypothetical protein